MKVSDLPSMWPDRDSMKPSTIALTKRGGSVLLSLEGTISFKSLMFVFILSPPVELSEDIRIVAHESGGFL